MLKLMLKDLKLNIYISSVPSVMTGYMPEVIAAAAAAVRSIINVVVAHPCKRILSLLIGSCCVL